ncbi:MAG: alpha/beta hydrolase [Paludibacter sp.]|nr:alpha/beta hydrolase [Paludibacter sp.]
MKRKLIIFVLVLLAGFSTKAQEIIPLYDAAIPNSKVAPADYKESFGGGMFRNVTSPTLEIYLPEKGKETGTAVVICPGGGYSVVVYQGEGVSNAKELAKNGIAAFVLKYRLPVDAIMTDKSTGPLQDAQQAIKLVRENAVKWNIDPAKIGIMGFSAGGHLASTVATHFEKALIDNPKGTSLRPDFQVVVYPVISMQQALTHRDSRKQLLGEQPSQQLVDLFSNELQVKENTPPAYITHAADDNVVDVDNSINYFEALRRHKVPVEMHIYPKGGHGFIFGRRGWMTSLLEWIGTTTNTNVKK